MKYEITLTVFFIIFFDYLIMQHSLEESESSKNTNTFVFDFKTTNSSRIKLKKLSIRETQVFKLTSKKVKATH